MTISNTPKPAYIYKNGTWYPISAPVNTAANYDWTGDHDFSGPVSFEEVLAARGGINNFQNPAARDLAIPSPVANGTVVFIRQDSLGNTINQIQYYSGGTWVNYNNIVINEKTASYTVALHDVDKLIKVNSTSNLEVIIPNDSTTNFPVGSRVEIGRYGSGEVTIVTPSGSGVTIRSVQNIYSIPFQYGSAVITKIANNEWWVFFSSFIGVTTTTASTTISTTESTTQPTTEPTTEPTSGTTDSTPEPTPTQTTATGIWYTYCGNVAAGYPPGTVIGPVYEAGGNCQTRFDQLTALEEIGSGWNCAPGNSSTSSVSAASCGTTTQATTAAPTTIWYGAACCDGSRIVRNSSASESAVIDALDAACGGTITEQSVVSVFGQFDEANYPSTSCSVGTTTTTTTSSSTTAATTTAAPVWYCTAIDCSAPGGPEEYTFQSTTGDQTGTCIACNQTDYPFAPSTSCCDSTTTAATTTAAPETTTTAAPQTTTAEPQTTTAAPATTTTAAPATTTAPGIRTCNGEPEPYPYECFCTEAGWMC